MAVAETGRPLNLRGSITMRVYFLLICRHVHQHMPFGDPEVQAVLQVQQDFNFILQGMIETNRKGTLMVKNQRCRVILLAFLYLLELSHMDLTHSKGP